MSGLPKAALALAAAGVLTAGLPGPAALAATRSTPQMRAAVVDALVACRKESDPTARLACFDKASAVLDEAEQKGTVVVLDREAMKTARRQAFGLDLSGINLFHRGPSAPEDRVDRVTLTIDHAGRGGDGKWRFYTDEGVVWMQTDTDDELRTPPHKGSQLAVRGAALGSYFCNVDGQRAVRCLRQH